MTRLLLVVAMLLAGCSGGRPEETEAESEYAPIGPGSDSSTLMPRDTPESQGESSAPAPPPRDTMPR